jgi:hypothetical protein
LHRAEGTKVNPTAISGPEAEDAATSSGGARRSGDKLAVPPVRVTAEGDGSNALDLYLVNLR